MDDILNKSEVIEWNNRIDSIIREFSDISQFLKGKEQATYLNHSKIQWTGGIIGAIAVSECRVESNIGYNTNENKTQSYYMVDLHSDSYNFDFAELQ